MSSQDVVRARVEHYRLATEGLLADVDPVPAGTNVLVLGPPMVGRDDLIAEFVATGIAAGQPGVVVSATDPAATLRRDHPGLDRAFVVDSSTAGEGDGFDPDGRIASVATPDDITGIGMAIVKCTRAIGDTASEGVRIGVVGLSTILQYTDQQRVFNFLHTLTGRISAAGYVGLFGLDPSVHDDQTVNTIMSQFDGAIRLTETDDGIAFETVGL